MATLSTYTQQVQNEVDDTSNRARSVIEQAIKDTYQEILRFSGRYLTSIIDDTVTATIGQRYITTTYTFQDIFKVMWKSATSDNYVELPPMQPEEYYEKYVNRDPGDPGHYYRDGMYMIVFDITPDNAGTVLIAGQEEQQELAGNVVSVLPDRFTQVLLLGSIARFKAYEGLEDAKEYFRMYRGPYFEQGRIGGALKHMLDELQTNRPIPKLKLFGK